MTTSDAGKELGEFSVSVELARHSGQDCLLIHANSHGALDNVPMGTSVTGKENSQRLRCLSFSSGEVVFFAAMNKDFQVPLSSFDFLQILAGDFEFVLLSDLKECAAGDDTRIIYTIMRNL